MPPRPPVFPADEEQARQEGSIRHLVVNIVHGFLTKNVFLFNSFSIQFFQWRSNNSNKVTKLNCTKLIKFFEYSVRPSEDSRGAALRL